jgi:hypothetical protein
MPAHGFLHILMGLAREFLSMHAENDATAVDTCRKQNEKSARGGL